LVADIAGLIYLIFVFLYGNCELPYAFELVIKFDIVVTSSPPLPLSLWKIKILGGYAAQISLLL
jgi:hypothetical protein